MTSIAVVILNWNGWKDTIDCLKSIKNSSIKMFELKVIVVDNASTNDSVLKLKKFMSTNKTFTLIENSKNLGFAGGNNVGIKYALEQGCDYICLLNNDTEIQKSFFTNLLEASVNHPKAGVISPKIYFYKGFEFHKDRYNQQELGKVIWYAGGVIDWKNMYGSNFGVDEVDVGQFKEDIQTDFATGACMFFPVNVLKKVGLFNENYYLYLEDVELSKRIKESGYEVWFASESVLWHKVSQSSAIGSNLNDYYITRNRLLFGMKYAPIRTKIALFRESLMFILAGRPWQRRGTIDYYLGNLKKGSWVN